MQESAKSLLVRSEYIGLHGYRTTVTAPNEATHFAVLSAIYRINPDGYTPAQADQIARDILSMHNPERAVYGGEPFIDDEEPPLRAAEGER